MNYLPDQTGILSRFSARHTMTRILFSCGIFVGSFLLFLIQPMVGKILLPALGGVPAVWTTCMLFFQAALLAGYLYAEKSIRWLGCEKQSVLHLMLMTGGFMLLPVNIDMAGLETAHISPASWLFGRLTVSIGFLFFIIAANAPLLQRYYSKTSQEDASDPYFLYSASNAGSLIALLVFPIILEPLMTATKIRSLWSGLYIFQTLLVAACCFKIWGLSDKTREELSKLFPASTPNWFDRLRWCFYGFVPCSAMLSVTTHITTDIASAPLIWVVPLSLYLISFILVYARSDFWRSIRWEQYMFPAAVLTSLMYYYNLSERAWLAITLHLLFMFLVCMCFHGRLAQDRPAAEHLNSYFVWMSAGGIVGGIFNGIAAPLVFDTQIEYLITILLAAFSAPLMAGKTFITEFSVRREIGLSAAYVISIVLLAIYSSVDKASMHSGGNILLMVFSLVIIDLFRRYPRPSGAAFLLACVLVSFNNPSTDSRTLLIKRSFFGVLKITRLATDGEFRDPDLKIGGIADVFYRLHHGTTLHGVERRVKVRPVVPLSYYSREGPVGSIFKAALINRSMKSIGVIGLGCGTVAWYGRPWQNFDFFEIDPEIVKIAGNPDYFTYLSSSKAPWRIIVGDARIRLQQIPDNSYDLLFIDAYSSDSVPVHLLTLQAFQLYRKKIKDDGLIVFHVSNRYLKLEPVIRRICDRLGLSCLASFYEPARDSIRYDWYDYDQMARSNWVAASARPEKLELLKNYGMWKELPDYQNYSVWTDDYVNLLQVYNWR